MAAEDIANISILGEAPAFLTTLERVSRAAPLSKPVLVIGERGTGKELIASRLHFLSSRWDQPLVKLNCAALTESILESELFGHEAGAFTGASQRRIGRFEQAHGGTLILDELGTIPPRMQEKILRVIEYGEFERVGGSDTVRVDVRIVGSTNADLQAMARDNRFRHDLLDRLAFDVITVPPLRARREDTLLLADHFAINLTAELGLPFFPGFDERVREQLMHYSWPGNVRELKHVVERSVYRNETPDEPLTALILNPFESPFSRSRQTPAPHSTTPDTPEPVTGATAAGHVLPLQLKQVVAGLEAELLDEAMEAARHNQKKAAELLGLSYHQLRGLVRKYGYSPEKRISSM